MPVLSALMLLACPPPDVPILTVAPATPVTAGGEIVAGPTYSLTLEAEGEARFPVAPTRGPGFNRFAGQLGLTVPVAGSYRVQLDSDGWVDLVRSGATMLSVDHRGGLGCPGPRLAFTFRLAPGRYGLLISGAAGPAIRVAVTPVG